MLSQKQRHSCPPTIVSLCGRKPARPKTISQHSFFHKSPGSTNSNLIHMSVFSFPPRMPETRTLYIPDPKTSISPLSGKTKKKRKRFYPMTPSMRRNIPRPTSTCLGSTAAFREKTSFCPTKPLTYARKRPTLPDVNRPDAATAISKKHRRCPHHLIVQTSQRLFVAKKSTRFAQHKTSRTPVQSSSFPLRHLFRIHHITVTTPDIH